MPEDKPIKIVSLDYWGREGYLSKLQVNYSNGVTSPLFEGPKPSDTGKMTVNVGDVAQIRKLIGTKEGYNIRQLILRRADRTEVGRIETSSGAYLSNTETVLAEGEEIVGVYGKYDSAYIDGLGLIVWKPSA